MHLSRNISRLMNLKMLKITQLSCNPAGDFYLKFYLNQAECIYDRHLLYINSEAGMVEI